MLTSSTGSGVGKHAAQTIVSRGISHLICADINQHAVINTVLEINHSVDMYWPENKPKPFAVAIRMDVTSEHGVEEAFREARIFSPTGRIDYFINAAGVSPSYPLYSLHKTHANQLISLARRI